jgi:histidinol-phosphate/aromatic aminotransferase/cobyric acid decarboxylase-like protein
MSIHGGRFGELVRKCGLPKSDCFDLSASITPLGFPPWTPQLINNHIEDLLHYPDEEDTGLTNAAARRYGCRCDEVIAGNGSSELLFLLPQVLKAQRVLIPTPAYVDYARAFELHGWELCEIPCFNRESLQHDWQPLKQQTRPGDLVIIGHPINPTGQIMAGLQGWIRQNPEVTFIIDEAYGDFLPDEERLIMKRPSNAVVLTSLTKSFGVPGLRTGLMIADQGIINHCQKRLVPWSMNTFARRFSEKALGDLPFMARSQQMTHQLRERFVKSLPASFSVVPSKANFVLTAHPKAGEIVNGLSQKGIALRPCHNFHGLDHRFIRIAVGTEMAQKALLAELKAMGLD